METFTLSRKELHRPGLLNLILDVGHLGDRSASFSSAPLTGSRHLTKLAELPDRSEIGVGQHEVSHGLRLRTFYREGGPCSKTHAARRHNTSFLINNTG